MQNINFFLKSVTCLNNPYHLYNLLHCSWNVQIDNHLDNQNSKIYLWVANLNISLWISNFIYDQGLYIILVW